MTPEGPGHLTFESTESGRPGGWMGKSSNVDHNLSPESCQVSSLQCKYPQDDDKDTVDKDNLGMIN